MEHTKRIKDSSQTNGKEIVLFVKTPKTVENENWSKNLMMHDVILIKKYF